MEGLASVADALRAAARGFGDTDWVVTPQGRLTFAQADRRARVLAAGLAARGLQPGDRVAIVSPNRLEVVELFAAASIAGVVQVPMNVYLRGEGLRFQLADAAARVVVADGPGVAAVAAIADSLPDLELVVALDDEDADGGAGATPVLPARIDTVAWADLPKDGPTPEPSLGRSTLHSIVYTSGTTGQPKGCMLGHGYYLASSAEGGRLLGYTRDDVALTALPLYHGFARGLLMSGLLYGLTIVVEEAFSPAAFLQRARAVNATVLQLVGAMAHALLALPQEAGDAGPALRKAVTIPLDPERAAAFERRFGAPVQAAVYGQTETGGIAVLPVGEPAPPGTLGRPAPNFEVRLVDDGDVEVPAGEVGEVVVRPRTPWSTSMGYWRRPEETATAWRNLWLHTGDLARSLPDGTLVFVDRKGDALRRRGENVASAVVEAALLRHDAVAEAAVHAVASAATEDDIKAVLVLHAGASITPREVFDVAREYLPYFAVPRYVEVVDELPRTVTLRVRKHVLRERGITPETWDLQAMGLVVARDDRR